MRRVAKEVLITIAFVILAAAPGVVGRQPPSRLRRALPTQRSLSLPAVRP